MTDAVLIFFGSVISLLLGIVAYHQSRTNNRLEKKLDKHDDELKEQQKEIHTLTHQTQKSIQQNEKAIELLRQNQQHDRERFELFEKVIDKLVRP